MAWEFQLTKNHHFSESETFSRLFLIIFRAEPEQLQAPNHKKQSRAPRHNIITTCGQIQLWFDFMLFLMHQPLVILKLAFMAFEYI